MSSLCKLTAALALFLAGTLAFASMPPLRACADADNLPFSNQREQGFEDALARMVAHDLHRDIQFVWLPQQEIARKRALARSNCDILTATNAASALMVPTVPYYRSTYVFVSRRDRHIGVASLSDARLARYRIGVHLIGGDDATVPPAQELVRRGLVRNLVGYSIYGRPLDGNPGAQLMTAVARGQVDMAVAWGPMAGFFAKKSAVPLQVTPICPVSGPGAEPMSFAISMGVRRGDSMLLEQLNTILARRKSEIRALLRGYGVPLLPSPGASRCR